MRRSGGKSIKIVRIIARLNIGGPSIHTILLSSELNKRGYSDILVSGSVSGSEGDMAYLAKDKGVEPVIVSSLARDISPLNDLRALLRLISILRRERPSIVHTHTAKAGTLGRVAAICAGVPIKIHTFHGHIFDGYFSPGKAKIFLFIERFLAFFTDKVVTVSEKMRDEIVHKLKVTSAEKCVVVPLGLELEKFMDCGSKKGAFKRELGIDSDTVLVGIVGRLVPIKNHTMFLDAVKYISGSHVSRKLKFVVVGDGELNRSLEAYARKLGVENMVIFAGWKKDLSLVYADLDIVVLTSLNEGTPVSLIEAMASGKPVVSTSVGGVPDLVRDGDNGFLSDPNDVEGFSEKVLILLNDPEKRAAFGDRGRAFVQTRFSKERLVRDIEGLYNECLKGELGK